MEKKKADIEKLLLEGHTIQISPIGYSMYPLFVPGRDEAVIRPSDLFSLKRGDVVLYRRMNSILVLHRIWKIGKDGFYMVGDNQMKIEGPISSEQICGRLVGFVRKGRKTSISDPLYILYSKVWLWLRPCRHSLSKFIHIFRSGKRT